MLQRGTPGHAGESVALAAGAKAGAGFAGMCHAAVPCLGTEPALVSCCLSVLGDRELARSLCMKPVCAQMCFPSPLVLEMGVCLSVCPLLIHTPSCLHPRQGWLWTWGRSPCRWVLQSPSAPSWCPVGTAKGFTHQPGAGAGTCVSTLEEEGTGGPMSALLAKGGGSHLCPGGLEPLYRVLSPVWRGGQAQSCIPF